MASHRVVLLGEEHDDAQHHAWQLHTLAALHAARPALVLGFEGFPRRVQPILDRWVAGEFSEAEFLRAVEWDRNWAVDAKLYMPLFQFARMHRVPLLAMNVERTLVNETSTQGWRNIPEARREGISTPAPAPRGYLEELHPAWRAHQPETTAASGKPDLDDPDFLKFVDGMLLWDRAMAQAIAQSLQQGTVPLVVGIVGRGHIQGRNGIPRQLADMGILDTMVALPWDVSAECEKPSAITADAVFGMSAKAMRQETQRLGVELKAGDKSGGSAVEVHRVMPGSIAESAGLQTGDRIERIASVRAEDVATVIAAVRRQAPGTWLPLSITREGQTLEIIAKFPPAP